MKPRIAITIGDPAGVGSEVVLKALADETLLSQGEWIIVGDRIALEETAIKCGAHLELLELIQIVDPHFFARGEIQPGQLSPKCGQAAMNYVRIATELCLQSESDAMVTAPLNKEAVALTNREFRGHTEYIAELCGVKGSRMLLWNKQLAVVHVSTHVSLRRAVELDEAKILRTIELGYEAIRFLGTQRPRVAVCGLNPHAGEHGLFGGEDEEFIAPAVSAAVRLGIPCEGPLPADTIFIRGVRGAYDLIVAMYHDQGHIPMKLIDFEDTVNISLGIPIIRTSVDHGTAFDIAGKNLANPNSMVSAMTAALTMANGRSKLSNGGTQSELNKHEQRS